MTHDEDMALAQVAAALRDHGPHTTHDLAALMGKDEDEVESNLHILSRNPYRFVQRNWERTNVWEYVEPSPFRKVMWALRDEQNSMR